jgi:hypothetical protein
MGKIETPESLFGQRWQDVLRFNRIDRRHIYPGISLKVPLNLDDVVNFTPMPQFYPEAEQEEKFILIDLAEQFLGAYEYGLLVFSAPVATGEKDYRTPTGLFKIEGFHREHRSFLYFVEKTTRPYPMNYGLRFYTSPRGVDYWIHGRDIPGYPASHGCIGLYDEPMQKEYYGRPQFPVLEDAKILYEWAIGTEKDAGSHQHFRNGPPILIVGQPPL